MIDLNTVKSSELNDILFKIAPSALRDTFYNDNVPVILSNYSIKEIVDRLNARFPMRNFNKREFDCKTIGRIIEDTGDKKRCVCEFEIDPRHTERSRDILKEWCLKHPDKRYFMTSSVNVYFE